MQPRKPDDSLNLEDSTILELGRLITGAQPADEKPDDPPPELPAKPRHGDTKSRELLTNPFDEPDGGTSK